MRFHISFLCLIVCSFAHAQVIKYSDVCDGSARILCKIKDEYLMTEKTDSGIAIYKYNTELSGRQKLSLYNNTRIDSYYPIFWKESILLISQLKRSKSLLLTSYSLNSNEWAPSIDLGLGDMKNFRYLLSMNKKQLGLTITFDSAKEQFLKCLFVDADSKSIAATNTVKLIDKEYDVFLTNEQEFLLSFQSSSWKDKLQVQVVGKHSDKMIPFDDSLFKRHEILGISLHPVKQSVEVITRGLRNQYEYRIISKSIDNDSMLKYALDLSKANIQSSILSDLDRYFVIDKLYQYPSGEMWIMEYRDTAHSIIQYDPLSTQPIAKPMNKVNYGDLLLITLDNSYQFQSSTILRKNQEFEVDPSAPAGFGLLKQKNRIYFLFSDQWSNDLRFILYNFDGTVKYSQSKVNLPDGYRFFFEEFLQTAHSEAILPARKGNKIIFAKIKIQS